MRTNNITGFYKLTEDDVKGYQRILNATYDLDIRSSGEKSLTNHGTWKIFAPAKDKIYYTATGDTLTQAVDNWFTYIKEKGTEPFFGG